MRGLISILCLSMASIAAGQGTGAEVDRLFRQASSGEIRFQSVVKPSKDSLIAMADSASKYLVAKLNTTDAREKVTLVEIFRGIGKSATPYLVTALKTDSKDQLRTTSRCLAEVKDTAAISHLLPASKHADFTVRAEAITAIGKSGGGETTARLLESMLGDPVEMVRKSIVYGMGTNRAASSVPLLIASLNDESFAVRLSAYDALVTLDSLAHDSITSALSEVSTERQFVLLLRLAGQLKISKAKSQVIDALTDKSALVRGWAVWSCARLDAKSAKSRLEKLTRVEPDQFVQSQIQDALVYLSTSKLDE